MAGAVPKLPSRNAAAPIGIAALDVYIPRLRLERASIAAAHSWGISLGGEARGEKAICDFDEDALTIGVEAVRAIVPVEDRGRIGRLVVASTSLPFAEPSNSATMAAALGLSETAHTTDSTGGLRAGTSAMLDLLDAGDSETVLVASDDRRARPASIQEMRYGSAAVAMRFGGEDMIARYVGGLSITRPLIDHFRLRTQDHDYGWEERWVREEGYLDLMKHAFARLMAEREIDPHAVKYLLIAPLVPGVDKLLARQLGLNDVDIVPEGQQSCGHAGTAAPLVQLAVALERASPGDVILIGSLGYGCDVLALEVTEGVDTYRASAPASRALANRQLEPAYLKYLSFTGAIELDWGMRAEFDSKTSLSQAYRVHDQLIGFNAGRCVSCGVVQFPVLAACVACASAAGTEPVSLADAPARLVTFTADWLSYTPSPPIHLGLVQFDNGARVFMEIADLTAKEALPVGAPVRMVFRRKDDDNLRGYTRYFWKASPLRRTTDSGGKAGHGNGN